MNQDKPAHKSMIHYYMVRKAARFCWRSGINMPLKLDQDLKKFASDVRRLTSLDDLYTMRGLAHHRRRGINAVEKMCAAAKANNNALL